MFEGLELLIQALFSGSYFVSLELMTDYFFSGPPVLPLKERLNGTDNQSLSNFDTQSNMSGSRDDIASIRKKKAPPPPPPEINYNGAMTPPTPPRKAPLNAP